MKKIFLCLLLLSIAILGKSQSRDTTYFIYQNLGPNVNSDYNESGPRISPDGSSLYFFRIDHPEDLKGSNDIWVSHVTQDSNWTVAERLGTPLNNYSDNAVHSISEDGKMLLVHDIYLSNLTSKAGLSITTQNADGSWSFPKPLKIKKYENTNKICSFYLSDDWETLILAIENSSTLGKQDLYVSFHDKAKNTWSQPINLGKTINTSGSEATAYLASDQKTLYYSSDGLPNSKGGFDIYKTVRQDDSWTNWSTPENIGSPYNTDDDEFYFSLPAHAGGWAYLAHSHAHGHSDITRIKKVTEPLPDPEMLLSGLVYDKLTNKTLKSTITFTLIPTGDLVGETQADTNKVYEIALKGYKSYKYTVIQDGYEPYEGTIELTTLKGDSQKKMDIYLTPIPRPVAMTIQGLEFATAKWDIQAKYVPELDKAFLFLTQNPDFIYEIAGHTDDVGTEASNQILSDNRAKVVKDYLVKKGIAETRLKAVGYGELKPLVENNSDENRQRNRRVELIKL